MQNRELIKRSNWNLRSFFYMEDVPEIQGEGIYLDSDIVEEIIEKVNPKDYPDQEFAMLEISKMGFS